MRYTKEKLASNVFKDGGLPSIEWVDMTTVHDYRPSLLITSPSALTCMGRFNGAFNFTETIQIVGGDEDYLSGLLQKDTSAETIYAVGGGRVVDMARLFAHSRRMSITVIPTIISSDSPFVDCTGVRKNGCVGYIPAKKADRVLLDFELLQQSPAELHAGGSVDVLSIYTALHDWKLVGNRQLAQPDETYSPVVAQQAQEILQYLLSHAADIKTMSKVGLNALVLTLTGEVALCNSYGNSRPEEGGEHFFAYALENKLPHTTHGELVGLGILMTACVQGQPWKHIREFMDASGLNYRPRGISEPIVHETLAAMRSYVEKHNLRYSVWNEYDYDASDTLRCLEDLRL